MSQEFLLDFRKAYAAETTEIRPDVVARDQVLFVGGKEENAKWAVTRQYLVEHVLRDTSGLSGKIEKHLPRCMEPHRDKWKFHGGGEADKYGWDYFDFEACPQADVYPCKSTT
jgi:hypothetical protein